ncbi:Multidrug resistance-associated protein 1 [Coemansia sp. RSA 1358]|nr:Multidrug resistance-associated protein 1 [Coemansia sp. RSA 1358]
MFGWERAFADPKVQQHWKNLKDRKQHLWYAPIARIVWFAFDIISMVSNEVSTYLAIYSFVMINPDSAAVISSADIFQLALKGNFVSTLPHYPVDSAKNTTVVDTKAENDPLAFINTGALITVENCKFAWKDNKPVLKDITFNAKADELVAVVGRTGTGKSSLLLSICGEVEMMEGSGAVVGSIAYMEQSPWIMHDTVRANIIFGRSYDKEYYNKVVYACALLDDINIWKNGDQTVIGERGVNISGGQRARLALARAVYSRADIYVLDDPLSAVDAHVKRHILDHVVMDSGLLAGKLRILSVHDKQLLPFFNKILKVDGGHVAVSKQVPKVYKPVIESQPVFDKVSISDGAALDAVFIANQDHITSTITDNGANKPAEYIDKRSAKLQGWSSWDNALYTLQLCGLPVIALIVFTSTFESISAFIIGSYKLDALGASVNSNGISNEDILRYLRFNMFGVILYQFMQKFKEVVNEAINNDYLDSKIKRIFVENVIHAPLSYFDSTTRQEISLAYNEGTSTIAKEIPTFFMNAIEDSVAEGKRKTSDTISDVSTLVQMRFLGYQITSGEFVMYSELANKLVKEWSLLTEIPTEIPRFLRKVNRFRKYTTMEKEQLFVEDAIIPPQNWPQLGKIEFRNFSMKYRSDLEYALEDINLTINPGEKVGIVGRTGAGKSSLSRALFRLIDNKTCEGSILIDGNEIHSINIGNLRSQLGTIPQEPTLFSGMFRQVLDPLMEYTIEDMWAAIIKCGMADLVAPQRKRKANKKPAFIEESNGHNDSNNVDTDSIECTSEKELRLKKEIMDWEQKWKNSGWFMRLFYTLFISKPRLASAEIKTIRPHGLDRYVFGCSQFSNGQQQLFGLCRLLMRKRKIIVLDEATADVDLETDQHMQKLIRSELKDCTVLTIAHRLDTIMKSDRIIVMNKGRAIEVGPPSELLKNGGHFAELVKADDFGS